jgi:hypothetical protein
MDSLTINDISISCNILKESSVIDSPLNLSMEKTTKGIVKISGNSQFLRMVTIKANNISYADGQKLKEFIVKNNHLLWNISTTVSAEFNTNKGKFMELNTAGVLQLKTNDLYELSFSYSFAWSKQ